ncbi:hypothetical protein MMC22_002203 [Lobaria immixta]|nr:hypothetical protein [Lobaria immixta]
MGLFSNPKLPYFVRIAQLLLSIGFLILICYAGTHRGWWKEINGALAIGVITSILTFAVTVHTIVSHHRGNPFADKGKIFTFVRLGVEALTILLWIASATLMLRHKKGCDPRRVRGDGQNTCWNGEKDFEDNDGIAWTDQPLITWDIAIAFSFVEMYAEPPNTPIWLVLVWKS